MVFWPNPSHLGRKQRIKFFHGGPSHAQLLVLFSPFSVFSLYEESNFLKEIIKNLNLQLVLPRPVYIRLINFFKYRPFKVDEVL
jgi:hypothetical protein